MNQPTMHFTEAELNPHGYPMDAQTHENIGTLIEKLSLLRDAWGRAMHVTSGLRSAADQMRINPSAPKSHHVTGEAADIADSDGRLAEWTKANLPLMEQIGLWMEDFDHTHGWVHYQISPPKSGHRVFVP